MKKDDNMHKKRSTKQPRIRMQLRRFKEHLLAKIIQENCENLTKNTNDMGKYVKIKKLPVRSSENLILTL